MAKVSGPPHLPAQFAPLSGARGHPASERRTSSKVDKDDAALIERVRQISLEGRQQLVCFILKQPKWIARARSRRAAADASLGHRPAGETVMMSRLILLGVAALLAILHGPAAASAQSYPQRAVRFILPFGPAAGVDITARLLGGTSRRALGQAGRGREPSGRRRPRRDQRLHQRQRRPHAAVRPGLHLYGSPLYARQAALRSAARPAADRERHDHRDRAGVSRIPAKSLRSATSSRWPAPSPGTLNVAAAAGNSDFILAGFLKRHEPAGGQGAVSRHHAGAERPGRRTHPASDVVLRQHASA